MCTFCRIIEGSAPGHVVYEDALTFAFLDINPISDGHTLIVPRLHVERVEDLPPEHAEALLDLIEAERNGYVPNVVYSCGALVHNGILLIPYGISDAATGFATVELTGSSGTTVQFK